MLEGIAKGWVTELEAEQLRRVEASASVGCGLAGHPGQGDSGAAVGLLHCGCTDSAVIYIVKPFEMKELIARINAVLRRTEIPNDTSKKLHFDKLTIDLDSYELIVDGKKIDTPPKELELLYHLAATPQPGLYPEPAAGRGLGL